jgi:hypothetical protein
MIVKSIALAMMLFFGALGVARAQSPEPTALGGSQTASTSTKSTTGPITEAVVFGWNYVHAAVCYGAGGYFYLIAQEGSVWFTNDVTTLIGLAPACQTGNFVGFHVFSSNGSWDQVYAFPFK